MSAAVIDVTTAVLQEVETYQEGFTDGVEEVLAQIEGSSLIAGTDPYHGPVAPELADWSASVRRRVAEVRCGA